MPKQVNNKYSAEAGDPFADPMGGGMGGGMDMGMGGGFGGGGGMSSTPTQSNGLLPQDNVMVRGMKRLRKLLGVSFPKDLPKLTKEKKINLFAYTPNELKYQPGFANPSAAVTDTNFGASSLYEYLNQTATKSTYWEREAKQTSILSPEIEAAREIMVASIMSPVDLQTNKVNVMIDDSSLSEEVEQKLTEILSNYFNNELKLGRKLSKWIGNALYQTGASPVLILPQSNIYSMNKIVDYDLVKAGIDPNALLHGIKPTTRPMDGKKISSGESFDITSRASFEGLKIEGDQFDSFVDKVESDCLYGIEKLDFISDKHKDHIISNRGKFKEGLKDVLANGKNWIRFSADPSILKQHEDTLKGRTAALQKEIDAHLIQKDSNPIYNLNMDTAENDTDIEAASIIELPYQSVVPIIVPGSPNQHIGYFIVVNQWGEPVFPDGKDVINDSMNGKVMDANMQATFGTPSALAYSEDMNHMQRFKTTSAIFGIMLRNFMQKKLEEYGLGGTQIEQHEAITACIFRNLIDKKNIGLIFVPEPMMVYYRYAVHSDGTGMSLIEGIRTITGLRTTLVTSGVMAATENSIDQKIIEVNVDDKNVNVQQMLEQLKNAFIEKRIMRYDNNPLNVQRELVQKSLTLVPKGIRGLNDSLNITTDHKSQGSVMPDDSLLKQLNDWQILGLRVPGSAINKVGEEDFARSVVTTNMFFNNRVKIYQEDTNEFTTKLVKNYIKYNTVLQEKILEVLRTSETDYEEYATEAQELSKDQKEEAQAKAEKVRESDTHEHKSDTKIEKNKKSPKQNLLDVLDHVKVKLPEPRIVVDKAQYEEITGYADCVKRVCEEIYSDELLPDSMQDYTGMLRVLRARIKEKMVRDFIKTVGCQSKFDMPKLSDLDVDDSEELSMLLINYKRGLDNIKEQVADKVNVAGGQDQSGMGGGYGSDMGGGFGSGGSGFGGGGSDMTGGGVDMNMDMSNDTNGQTPENESESGAEESGETSVKQ